MGMVKMTATEFIPLFKFLDVMRFELVYYIAPDDLLNLARTCKKLRSDLWNEPAIWKRALAQSALALVSIHKRHPRSLVILHFTKECMVCGTETNSHAIEELVIRLCENCEGVELTPVPDQPPGFRTTIWQNGPHQYVTRFFRRDPPGSGSITRLEPVATLANPASCFIQVADVPVFALHSSSQPTWPQSDLGIQTIEHQFQVMAYRQHEELAAHHSGGGVNCRKFTPTLATFDSEEKSPGPGPTRSRSTPRKEKGDRTPTPGSPYPSK